MSEAKVIERAPVFKPETTSDERLWATLAHLSTLLTLIVSLGSGGLGGLFLVFVPFIIYVIYKDKSEFVAYHAAQAFAIQVVGTVGYFVAILVGVLLIVIFWILTGLLSAILIGLILIPVAILLTVAVVAALVAYPFVLGTFSVIAAVQTGSGTDYRAPYVGPWVADWLQQQNHREATPAL